jgi:flagellar M-ring protein FliF
MDFLNKGYTQLVDLFKSMTPGARITAGLLLIVIVISLAYLVNRSTNGQESFLMGGEPFAASQLPAMEAAFAKANLHGARVEGNRIRVPLGMESQYMGALSDAGALPATFGTYLGKAVQTSPWWTKDQREMAKKIAIQNELSLIISHMQGIESAAVMYDSQESVAFGEKKMTTASVNVKPQGSSQLPENQVRMIRASVSSAIAGLKPESVTIIDLNGRTYAGGGSEGGMLGGADDPYRARKSMYEKDWAEKITNALSYIPGVLVTSNVELDLETAHEESQTDFDPKSVPYQQRESSNNKQIRGPVTSGRPGPTAQNGVNQPASVGSASGSETTEEVTQAETQSAVSSKSKTIRQTGLTPTRVTVTVSVPSSYYEKVWFERNPTPVGQEAKRPDEAALKNIETDVTTNVQKTVVSLLPSPGSTVDPFPRVTVTSHQFLPGTALPAPSVPDKALAWAGQYWSTLGMIAVALVSLGMLRSLVRAAPTSASAPPQLNLVQPPDEAREAAEAQPSDTGELHSARSRLKRKSGTGPSLRDELSELIKEDPDAAVSVLRAWIGNAS